MTNTEIPARPTYGDPRIREAVADKLVPLLVEYCREGNGEDNPDLIRRDILAALRSSWPLDGYKRAKYLDDHFHWEGDTRLVEILENAAIYESDARNNLVKEWVQEHGLTLALHVGATVRVKVRGVEYDGVIAKSFQDTTCYLVRIPALGHVESGVGTHGQIFAKEQVEACARC